MSFADKVMESGKTINAVMVIGFLGIIWLIIYGNLSGNLGFGTTTESLTDNLLESNLTEIGQSPVGARGKPGASITNVVMTNASLNAGAAETITAGNFTVSGILISSTSDSNYNNSQVNITSFDVTFDSVGKSSTESVIENMTIGVNTFFGFSPTWFIILAIMLLIVILVGLLAIVLKIANSSKGDEDSRRSSGDRFEGVGG